MNTLSGPVDQYLGAMYFRGSLRDYDGNPTIVEVGPGKVINIIDAPDPEENADFDRYNHRMNYYDEYETLWAGTSPIKVGRAPQETRCMRKEIPIPPALWLQVRLRTPTILLAREPDLWDDGTRLFASHQHTLFVCATAPQIKTAEQKVRESARPTDLEDWLLSVLDHLQRNGCRHGDQPCAPTIRCCPKSLLDITEQCLRRGGTEIPRKACMAFMGNWFEGALHKAMKWGLRSRRLQLLDNAHRRLAQSARQKGQRRMGDEDESMLMLVALRNMHPTPTRTM